MLVNGQFQTHLSVLDRATQYGDGAFETILIRNASLVFWDTHLTRLCAACARLKIPLDLPLLQQEVTAFLPSVDAQGILKIIISRGTGGRGYGTAAGMTPTRILQFHGLPEGYERNSSDGIGVFKCAHPISSNSALAGIKHLNRLDQVMASMELPSDAQEGLMCTDSGLLIEGIKSNVFLYENGHWVTPALSVAGVAGVMRTQIIEFCQRSNPSNLVIQDVNFDTLRSASEMLVCNSVFGIWPVTSVQWNGSVLGFAIGENTRHLQRSVWGSV